MRENYKPLGKYIQPVVGRNNDLGDLPLVGLSIQKKFIPSIANTIGTDMSTYRIIEKNQFAYGPVTSRNGDKITIALFNDYEKALISQAYIPFEVKDTNELNPEYLMMWFQRPESDRYGWFISDSSVRASLEWERFCEIQIPIPYIDEQCKFVALYNGLLFNQKTYENSLADLQLICDTYIENLIKTEQPKILGEYIEQADERNTDLKNDSLLGISVNKVFMETRSQKERLDLSNYKVVHPREFGYVSVTSRNGGKISIALLAAQAGLVSSTYTVFRVKDISELLPEYLFLWFARPEFDRYARFHSWGSARETFDWADMCNVKLPIPDIKVQEAIVTIYHTLETRKRINSQLKNTIKPLCPVLMKGAV